MPEVRTAAFFDVDNTLVRGASVYLVARGLHSRGLVGTWPILRGLWYQLGYRLAGERRRHLTVARESLLATIAGLTVAEIRQVTSEIYDELIADRLWPGTVSVAQRHLAVGEQVWLVTAAPLEIARVIAERLGFTGALGTRAEHRDEVYTGRLVGGLLHGPAKAEAVRALADERGLDLATCHAYSDSRNDLPLLHAVGHPCAVNPDRALRRHARHAGWPVQDFRTLRRWTGYGVAAAGTAATAYGVTAAVRRRARLPHGGSAPTDRGAG